MRIVFIEDDGMTALAPYVHGLGHQALVLRSGAYDAWHANECGDPTLRVTQLAADVGTTGLIDAALAFAPDALVSLALLDPHCLRDAGVGDFFRRLPGVAVVANTKATVRTANDKLATKELLKRHGIAVTEALAVEDLAEAEAAAERLGYPVVLKRTDGYAGMGMRLFHDVAALRRFYRRQPAAMLMEHFTDGIELSVDVLRWQGVARALTVVHKGPTDTDLRNHPIYRLRVAPAPIAAHHAAAALAIAERAMELLDIVGVAECEMILDPLRGPLVLEVNPRIAGTARLSAAASGVDIHRCLADMALGRCDLRALAPTPACAVQIPVLAPLDAGALAGLAALPEVRFVKLIDWMPDLPVSASLTVAAADGAALLAALARVGAIAELGAGPARLAVLLGAGQGSQQPPQPASQQAPQQPPHHPPHPQRHETTGSATP